MRRKDVTIGFSVNPEISYEYADSVGEKGALDSFTVSLSGTSANVATALKRLGGNPLLVVPSEKGESDASHLLDLALRRSGLTTARINILDQTPLAVYPVNGHREGRSLLYGRKGTLSTQSKRIERAVREIESYNGLWRIATGVDPGFAPLAWHLLGEKSSFRVFSPNLILCRHPEFSLLKSLLSRSDLLIINKLEFETLGRSESFIHELGVSLIVVTDGEKGGRFSLKNQTTGAVIKSGKYAAEQPTAPIFPIGAGDWFLAGLATSIMEAEDAGLFQSLDAVPLQAVEEACSFGAKVAGLKVTMRGGSAGPKREEL